MKPALLGLGLALAASVVTLAANARGSHPAAAASDAAPMATTAAATSTQPGTPQRSKMKTCNADAKTKALHGDDRRAFMKQCLSGKAHPATS